MADLVKTFVTGWPVEHSRSPLVHNYWLEFHGLPGRYEKLPCKPQDFSEFIRNLVGGEFVGGNVTIPHKETAFELITWLEPAAKRLGAVNTIWTEDGRLKGTNTDGYGFLANLDDQSPGWCDEKSRMSGALVLGAGGASRAVIDALVQREFSTITIANRTVERAEKLADQFGPACRAVNINDVTPDQFSPSIIVNTTALGMNDGQLPIALKGFSSSTIVNDIVYTPLWTPMLLEAKRLGMTPVDGLGMLLHQAVPGFEKWYGVRPKVTSELRNILLCDLGELS